MLYAFFQQPGLFCPGWLTIRISRRILRATLLWFIVIGLQYRSDPSAGVTSFCVCWLPVLVLTKRRKMSNCEFIMSLPIVLKWAAWEKSAPHGRSFVFSPLASKTRCTYWCLQARRLWSASSLEWRLKIKKKKSLPLSHETGHKVKRTRLAYEHLIPGAEACLHTLRSHTKAQPNLKIPLWPLTSSEDWSVHQMCYTLCIFPSLVFRMLRG